MELCMLYDACGIASAILLEIDRDAKKTLKTGMV